MEGTSIIKIEVVTVSQKIFDQIIFGTFRAELNESIIGWTSRSMMIYKQGTRLYKSSIPMELNKSIRENYPQIFIK